MKFNKIYHIVILSIFFLPILNAEELTKEDKKYFKHEQEYENISCLKPYIIEGIDKVYIKDGNDLLYIIEINGSEGTCSYLSNRIVFKRDTPQEIVDKVLSNYDYTIKMKLSFNILFNVRKMAKDAHLRVKDNTIKIPYFIVIDDRFTNNIILQQDYSINIPLTQITNKEYKSSKIVIEKDFVMKDFANMELLTGIYFNKVS